MVPEFLSQKILTNLTNSIAGAGELTNTCAQWMGGEIVYLRSLVWELFKALLRKIQKELNVNTVNRLWRRVRAVCRIFFCQEFEQAKKKAYTNTLHLFKSKWMIIIDHFKHLYICETYMTNYYPPTQMAWNMFSWLISLFSDAPVCPTPGC